MLNQFIALYIPSTNAGKRISARIHNRFVRDAARELSKQFGGATCTRGTGYWLSETGELIAESVTIVKSFHDKDSASVTALSHALAASIKTALHQEAVAVETHNGIEFI